MERPKFSAIFAQVVRQHRLGQGVSQEKLAERADLSRNYIGMLERGERFATLEVAERLARAIGVPLEQLITQARKELERGDKKKAPKQER
jgi:transcriptional regulator with XRE-family HTH domain